MDYEQLLKIRVDGEKNLYNVGIERAFISCILKSPELVRIAYSKVSVDDVYSLNFNVIYRTILQMKERYDIMHQDYDFNPCLIYKWMETREDLKNDFNIYIGKIEYVDSILRAPDTNKESFDKYIEILKEVSIRIKSFRMSFIIQDRAFQSSFKDNGDKIIQDVDDIFSSIKKERSTGNIVKLGDCIEELIQDSIFNKANKGRVGIYIPVMPRLMKVINGIRRTQFIILFARPKTGKSSLLLNFGIETAKQNIPVFYIDTEMSQKEQASRALSRMSAIKEWDIMDGSFMDDEEKTKSINEFGKTLSEQEFYYCAAKAMDIDGIIALIREFVEKYVGYEIMPNGKKKTKPCLIVYDWLKVADSDSLQKVKEYQELGFIATKLNDARRELDVPIIAGAQANRLGNDKDVGTNAAFNAQNFLADSDRLLRFCTCLIWLRRLNSQEMTVMLDKYSKTEQFYNQMIHVVDQRGGPICIDGIGLNFHGDTLTYEEKDKIDLTSHNKRRTEEEKDEAIKKKKEENDKKFATPL
ncbi:MAG: AAA family ATPase [Melioribacteraceae bacterium]|nr:AAA family ATPase [Melioribacteraceae bacterium]